MTKSKQQVVGKLLALRATEEMRDYARKHDLLTEGRIDLRGERVRFSHSDLDLTRFLLAGANLSDSELLNCNGEGVSFEGCVLKKVTIEAKRPRSFVGADFSRCEIHDSSFGRATLDLSRSVFRGAVLKGVEFILGRLGGASFEDARLSDTLLRRSVLDQASFRGAVLKRVSFERASLQGTDFREAHFDQMEHWGEPNFDGAVIADDLRYRYGIVGEPLRRLDLVLDGGEFSTAERQALKAFRSAVADFVGNGRPVMLIASEFAHVIPEELFVRVLKQMKSVPLN
jgi:uncharacterized protein YjbI with pentapeptide repeats